MSEPKIVHISIDDVSVSLKEINDQKYSSIFDSPFFKRLKIYHDLFGAKFSLYLFYKNGHFDLSQMSAKYVNDFVSSSDWLKLGFHSYSSDFDSIISRNRYIKYLPQAQKEITRFASNSNLTNTVRLHYFYADSDMILAANINGYKTFLTADAINRLSYDLNEYEINTLNLEKPNLFEKDKTDNNIFYIKTDFRLENKNFKEMINACKADSVLTIFTHEKHFDKNLSIKLFLLMPFLWSNNYNFVTNIN